MGTEATPESVSDPALVTATAPDSDPDEAPKRSDMSANASKLANSVGPDAAILAIRRWVQRIREDRGLCAVLAIVAIWCAIMYLHVYWRHDRYGTFDNDMGFHDQYIWLLARGHWFSTVLGLPAFGHNATFGYVLFVPLSWFGLGPQGINFITTIAVGLGAVPLYLIARDRFRMNGKPLPSV